MALLHNFSVNSRSWLCDGLQHASAQLLDFLEFVKNYSFLNWKLSIVYFLFTDETLVYQTGIRLDHKVFGYINGK
jgi:hypothetical protein